MSTVKMRVTVKKQEAGEGVRAVTSMIFIGVRGKYNKTVKPV